MTANGTDCHWPKISGIETAAIEGRNDPHFSIGDAVLSEREMLQRAILGIAWEGRAVWQ
jgi:hypothetical protein